MIATLILEKPSAQALLAAWLPIAYAGIFPSAKGYTLQIVGQKYADPSVVSIVMSLESVFAALAGWIILNERLDFNELIGCGLVFLSVILCRFRDSQRESGRNLKAASKPFGFSLAKSSESLRPLLLFMC